MQSKLVIHDSVVTVAIGMFFSMGTFLIGGVDKAFISMIMFISLDYLTGVLAAFYRGDVSSRKMYWGTVRKVCLLILIILAHHTDVIMESEGGYMRTAMIMFIVGVEGVSILENLGKLNLPIPPLLLNSLSRLRGKTVIETRVTTEHHPLDRGVKRRDEKKKRTKKAKRGETGE